MGLHGSLKMSTWKSKRTVRKKKERFKTYYETLLKQGGLSDEDIKIYGLPKEKILVVKPKKSKKIKDEEDKTT